MHSRQSAVLHTFRISTISSMRLLSSLRTAWSVDFQNTVVSSHRATDFYASANSTAKYVFWSSVWTLSVRPLSVRPSVRCSSFNAYFEWCDISAQWTDFNESWHKYSPCDWAALKGSSRSVIRGQGHDMNNYPTMTEAYISTVLLVLLGEQY